MPARKKPAAPAPSKQSASSKTNGRPKHEPTDANRRTVALMVAAGIDQDDIAACIEISPKTLRLHYGREIATSYARIKADIAGKLIGRARGTPGDKEKGTPEIPGELKAQIFFLETHGWVRSERVLLKDDGISEDADLSNLTDEQIEQRLARLRRTAAVSRAKRKP